MAVQGQPKSFLKKYKFIIECDRIGDTGFQKCSELESDIEVNEYAEGGSIYDTKDAGRNKFTNLTLTRGESLDDNDLYNWHLECAAAGADLGGVGDSYKSNMDVVSQNRDGSTGKRWRLFNAWPKRVKVGDWDNSSSEHLMNEAEIVFDYFIRVP
ncbi:hypothetical protein MASR1M48_17460 [Lactococcus petauri]